MDSWVRLRDYFLASPATAAGASVAVEAAGVAGAIDLGGSAVVAVGRSAVGALVGVGDGLGAIAPFLVGAGAVGVDLSSPIFGATLCEDGPLRSACSSACF